MTLFTRMVVSMPMPVGDTLVPQAAVSIDIGAHLLGM